jgi:D-alanyl-lipoteichoic acid acyltransferase DltB (MBOAT superfamily)
VDGDGIPLGISFYVFQLIAYQVDLARGEVAREQKFWRLLLYILFFPHHQAGPIMRPAKFLPQFHGEKRLDGALAALGGWWLLMGLTKKVLADTMAPVADQYFALALEGPVAAWQAWRGAMAFGFQIYGDFSGYSDIAVGLGYLLGYHLDINFDQPYLSASPAEFWRRWHITLSQWLRDYLYISLGGNRHGTLRTYVNLFLTMVLGGFWHGASWMFLLWGAIHGGFLALHRAFPAPFRWRPAGVLLTFVVVTAAWVPFRAVNLTQTGRILGAMSFVHTAPGDTLARWSTQSFWMLCIAGAYGLERLLRSHQSALGAGFQRLPAPLRGLLVALWVSAIALTLSTKSSYVYFRF